MNKKIDWKKFEDNYVRLDTGVEKQLKLTNWRQGTWFNMPGIGFDVIEEDGVSVNGKIFTTTSKRLIRKLKPIIRNADELGIEEITVEITRIGEGMNTSYSVEEV